MTPLPASTLETNQPVADPPGRSIGLTLWFILLLFLNAVAAVVLPFITAFRFRAGPSPDDPLTEVLLFAPMVLAAINIACLILLFKWKKWGFWGLCITSGFYAPTVYHLGGGKEGFFVAMGLDVVSLGILYVLLTLGDANRTAWSRLK